MTAWQRKRSRLEIYFDVLRVIRRGTNKPTRIMYSSNLSWLPLTRILSNLTSRGYIINEQFKGHSFYKITAKGWQALEQWDSSYNLFKEDFD